MAKTAGPFNTMIKVANEVHHKSQIKDILNQSHLFDVGIKKIDAQRMEDLKTQPFHLPFDTTAIEAKGSLLIMSKCLTSNNFLVVGLFDEGGRSPIVLGVEHPLFIYYVKVAIGDLGKHNIIDIIEFGVYESKDQLEYYEYQMLDNDDKRPPLSSVGLKFMPSAKFRSTVKQKFIMPQIDLSVFCIKEINDIHSKKFVVKATPNQIPRKPSSKLGVRKRHERPIYLIKTVKEIKKTIIPDTEKRKGTKAAHPVRGHWKLFSDQRYTKMHNKKIWIEPFWSGPQQAIRGGKTYKVLLT